MITEAIPIARKGHDLISVAKTGSGKTMAFMIPCMMQIVEKKQKMIQQAAQMGPQGAMLMGSMSGPYGLILAPTRELAIQIYNASKMMSLLAGLKISVVYGGADKGYQMDCFSGGTDIVIGTPGRLIDFLSMGSLALGNVNVFVLDEADRMLDMGFIPQIRQICSHLPSTRQSLFFSATWPPEVGRLSMEICFNKPVKIKVGSENLTLNSAITQNTEYVNDYDKRNRLVQLLAQINNGQPKIIIFMRTKKSCDRLTRFLEYEGWKAMALHGDKAQNQREYIINCFRRGVKNILIATDVASRGLDIKDIQYVINYDFPQSVEDYVHRIGRTGRAGATGIAYTFFNEGDVQNASGLLDILDKSKQPIPNKLRDLARMCDMKRKRRYEKYGSQSYEDNSYEYEAPRPLHNGNRKPVNPMMIMNMMNMMQQMMKTNPQGAQAYQQQIQTMQQTMKTQDYQAQGYSQGQSNQGYNSQGGYGGYNNYNQGYGGYNSSDKGYSNEGSNQGYGQGYSNGGSGYGYSQGYSKGDSGQDSAQGYSKGQSYGDSGQGYTQGQSNVGQSYYQGQSNNGSNYSQGQLNNGAAYNQTQSKAVPNQLQGNSRESIAQSNLESQPIAASGQGTGTQVQGQCYEGVTSSLSTAKKSGNQSPANPPSLISLDSSPSNSKSVHLPSVIELTPEKQSLPSTLENSGSVDNKRKWERDQNRRADQSLINCD